VIVESVPRMAKAAPTPIAARAAMSDPPLAAMDATALDPAKMPTPASRVRRRPNRSPKAPKGSRRAASATA
jgi:hypothetical protein